MIESCGVASTIDYRRERYQHAPVEHRRLVRVNPARSIRPKRARNESAICTRRRRGLLPSYPVSVTTVIVS